MAIDSHMHCNSLVTDVNETVKKINEDFRLDCVINVGLNIETSKEIIEISYNNPKFYCSIGIHPLYIKEDNCGELYNLYNDRVIAIGEIGLDNSKNNYENQKRYLIRQILIANELKLPIIIHANNSNKEVIEIFERYAKPKYGCVFHCFQPDMEALEYLINNEYYISFAGRITYKTAKKSLEIIKRVPNDLFLVETDSPYISPEPYLNLPNSSSNLPLIINKIAEVKEFNYEEIEMITINNSKRLFKI